MVCLPLKMRQGWEVKGAVWGHGFNSFVIDSGRGIQTRCPSERFLDDPQAPLADGRR